MPQARVELRIYSPSTGDLQAILAGPNAWNTLNLVRNLNSFDNMTLSLSEDDPNIQYFTLDAMIEIRRRLDRPGSQWYTETTLFHRTSRHTLEENGHRLFYSYSRGLNDLLHRRGIFYVANTAYTLKSGPGETIMKEFVNENAGPGANNSNRQGTWDASAPVLGLSIAPNAAQGLTWRGAATWRNLLDTLNEISVSTSVDFQVVRTGPRTFQFRTYYPQLGTDRSGYILFSPEFNNMTNIDSVHSRTEEANAVLILGQGERDQRRIYPAIDPASVDSPWNLIEFTRDARNQFALADMANDATKALSEFKAQQNFSFKILQTDARQYSPDGEYWFGDIVKAQYGAQSVIRKIVGVTFNVANGVENIDFELSEFPASAVG